jgi:hypothetical protein
MLREINVANQGVEPELGFFNNLLARLPDRRK